MESPMPRDNRIAFSNSWQIKVLGASFVTLSICEVFLIFDILAEYLKLDFGFFAENHGILEAIAAMALGMALLVLGYDIWRLIMENRHFRSLLGIASGELLVILERKFTEWALSDSEREIAFFLIKGLSLQEIADTRKTKPGTIKSQCSAIYRKAGIKGRSDLAAYFIEDLLAGDSLSDFSRTAPPDEGAP